MVLALEYDRALPLRELKHRLKLGVLQNFKLRPLMYIKSKVKYVIKLCAYGFSLSAINNVDNGASSLYAHHMR